MVTDTLGDVFVWLYRKEESWAPGLREGWGCFHRQPEWEKVQRRVSGGTWVLVGTAWRGGERTSLAFLDLPTTEFPCHVLHRPPIPCALSHRDPSVLLVVPGLPWNGQRSRFGHRKEDWVGGGGHHLAWNGHSEDRCGRTQATVPEPHDSFWNTHTDPYSLPWPAPSEQCLLTTLLLLLTGSRAASVTGTDVR